MFLPRILARFPWREVACLAALSTLVLVAACGSDDEDRPPQAEIAYPEPGTMFTSAPDSVVVIATDDRGVARVEIRLDGRLLSTRTRAPFSTRLPLGLYADGRPYRLTATAYDGRSQVGEAAPVEISIDPALQTVPQITAWGPASRLAEASYRLAWLPWPGVLGHFEWEVARDAAFAVIVASGTTVDTVATVPLDGQALAYARVRAAGPSQISGWSRTARFSGLVTWRRHHVLAGQQLGAALFGAPDGSLRVLSHGAAQHQVPRAPLTLLAVSATGDLLGSTVLDASQQQLSASIVDGGGNLVMAGLREDGGPFLAAATLEGQVLWSVAPSLMLPTALVLDDGGGVLAVGNDRRDGQPGGVIGVVGAGGEVDPLVTFPLAIDWQAQHAWQRPAGGWVLAGTVAGEADAATGGIWLMGVGVGGDALWTVRLGTAHRWLLRGGGADPQAGQYVLGGIAMRANVRDRYGFLLGVDQQGLVRWQVQDGGWHQFVSAVREPSGDWVVAGARRREVGNNAWELDVALRGLSQAGATIWEASHPLGPESQGWALMAHPAGGWYVAGARSLDRVNHDVELLRVDDRGALP